MSDHLPFGDLGEALTSAVDDLFVAFHAPLPRLLSGRQLDEIIRRGRDLTPTEVALVGHIMALEFGWGTMLEAAREEGVSEADVFTALRDPLGLRRLAQVEPRTAGP